MPPPCHSWMVSSGTLRAATSSVMKGPFRLSTGRFAGLRHVYRSVSVGGQSDLGHDHSVAICSILHLRIVAASAPRFGAASSPT